MDSRRKNHLGKKVTTAFRWDDKNRSGWTVGIVVRDCYLRSNTKGSVYELVSVDQQIPHVVDCDGVKRQLKMVLKIYTKVPESEQQKQRELRCYQRLLRGRAPKFV